MSLSHHHLGSTAVPFQLADTSGGLHRLEDHRGRWLLLMFHRHLA
jgi:peroxiredoxin